MNVLRTLVFDDEVSLTIADTTSIAKEGIKRHALQGEAAEAFARTLAFLTFASACLKMEAGSVSLAIKTDGKIVDLCASGDQALSIRGYLDWEEEKSDTLGTGTLAVIRDDGYNRPFVGACEVASKEDIDNSFEDYYFTSEQLPTFIKTVLKRDSDGEVEFCGIIVAQPLPFASEETFAKIPDGYALEEILNEVQTLGLFAAAEKYFGAKAENCNYRQAEYRCNCSREYLKGVIVSIGETELRKMVKEDGSIKVHCHYCNTDYEFVDEDIDELFPKK